MTEIWKAIPGYEGRYEVSNTGKVKSLNYRGSGQPKELSFALSRGYHCLKLPTEKFPGRRPQATFTVHTLVCTAFHGAPPFSGAEVRHLDGCRTNNNADNLVWGSRLENMRDKAHHGTDPKGDRHPSALLTEIEVIEIRQSSLRGCDLARRYGVTQQAISCIRKRRNWKHV